MPSPTSTDPPVRARTSRRDILRGVAAAGVATATAVAAPACAMGGDDSSGGGARAGKDATNPLGVDPAAQLEVVIFNGGFGEEYAKAHQELYRQRYPKAEIKHTATQEIAQTLQPRFVDGSPPDVVNNSGGNQIDFNGLVSQGALTELTELLDAPSLDDPAVTVRDTLLPGTVDVGSYDGKAMALNYAYTVYGIWYSGKLFADRGWAYPTTWDAMVSLCREIKKAGIAPWTYQGKHPRYMSWPIVAAAAKLGGPDVLLAVDNLEPNAWKHEALVAAADAYHQLVVDRFILAGSEGMDHVQAQTEWCRGNAAFVSCGSWLENEQKAVTPEGFGMTVAPTPSLTSGDKLPFNAVRGTAGEPFVVPARAKNVAGGLEYLRVMLSKPAAADFTRRVSSLTCVRGSSVGITLPPGLQTVDRVLSEAGSHAFTWMYGLYYRKLERNLIDAATGEFERGHITVQDMVTRQPWADDVPVHVDREPAAGTGG